MSVSSILVFWGIYLPATRMYIFGIEIDRKNPLNILEREWELRMERRQMQQIE